MSKKAEIFVRLDQELLDVLKIEANKCSTTLSTIVRMILVGERKPVNYVSVSAESRAVIESRSDARTTRRVGKSK